MGKGHLKPDIFPPFLSQTGSSNHENPKKAPTHGKA